METALVVGIIVLLFVLLVAGVPVAFSLGIAGIVGLLVARGFNSMSIRITLDSFTALATYSYVAIPLFILMGGLAYHAGVASDAYKVARQWVGHWGGGLACATVLGCGLFAATSGSSLATTGTIGRFAMAEMKKYGYDMKFAGATVACGGGLGILIPPSITLVLYGILVRESIGRLLLAGFLPGILSVGVYISGILILSRLRPRLAPPSPSTPWGERLRGLGKVVRVFILFLIVIGGIYTGIFTATEGAAMGSLAALIMLIIEHRGKNLWPATRDALLGTASTTAMILFLIMGVTFFADFLAVMQIPQAVSNFILGLGVPHIVTLILIISIYIPLGMFLDPVSMMLLTLPILYPAVIAMGYSGIWFGVIVVILVEMSLITPPVGLNVFVVSGLMPDIPMEGIFRHAIFYVILMFAVITILVAAPQIALFLPSVMMGK